MDCCMADEEFTNRIGLDLDTFQQESGLVEVEKDTKIVHFFPCKNKGKNYTTLVENVRLSPNKKQSEVDTIRKYTFHDTFYCTKINLLLASDSPDLKPEAEYIRDLQICIKKRAKKLPVTTKICFRGMHQSEKEFNAYGLNEIVYVPSFLSTSKNREKFYMSENNNNITEILLKDVPNNAIYIDSELSIYEEEEEEVLFNCYSKFKVLEKKRKVEFGGKEFEFYLKLEHLNQPIGFNFGDVLMLNALGF